MQRDSIAIRARQGEDLSIFPGTNRLFGDEAKMNQRRDALSRCAVRNEHALIYVPGSRACNIREDLCRGSVIKPRTLSLHQRLRPEAEGDLNSAFPRGVTWKIEASDRD